MPSYPLKIEGVDRETAIAAVKVAVDEANEQARAVGKPTGSVTLPDGTRYPPADADV